MPNNRHFFIKNLLLKSFIDHDINAEISLGESKIQYASGFHFGDFGLNPRYPTECFFLFTPLCSLIRTFVEQILNFT